MKTTTHSLFRANKYGIIEKVHNCTVERGNEMGVKEDDLLMMIQASSMKSIQSFNSKFNQCLNKSKRGLPVEKTNKSSLAIKDYLESTSQHGHNFRQTQIQNIATRQITNYNIRNYI